MVAPPPPRARPLSAPLLQQPTLLTPLLKPPAEPMYRKASTI
jgi:hypothetical protein